MPWTLSELGIVRTVNMALYMSLQPWIIMKQKPIGFTPCKPLLVYLFESSHSFFLLYLQPSHFNICILNLKGDTFAMQVFILQSLSFMLLQYIKNSCSLLFYEGDLCKFVWSLWGCCILWLLVYGKCIGTNLFITLSIGAVSLWSSTASLFKLSEEIFQQLLVHKQQLPP